MSNAERFCIGCKRLHIDLGEPGYSEMTPGWPGSVECFAGHFKLEHDDIVFDAMLKARTCADYDERDELKAERSLCVCGHKMADHIEGFDPCSLCECQEFRDITESR